MNKWLFAAGVAAVALFSAIAVGTSTATAQTIYCLNGVSTALPADVSASSTTQGDFTGVFTEEDAAWVLSQDPSGLFYAGYYPGNGDAGWYLVAGESPEGLEPGYSTNYVGLGACQVAEPVIPSRVGVCKMLMRGDGTLGLFQEITVADWNDPEGQYFDAPAANWVEGMGLTCDNPVALGYKPAGYNVAWGGKQDPAHDPNGVRASGFNNIYPYFTK